MMMEDNNEAYLSFAAAELVEYKQSKGKKYTSFRFDNNQASC